MKINRSWRKWIGLLLFIIALIVLVISFWPAGQQRQEIRSSFTGSLGAQPGSETPGLQERRLLTIEAPRFIRVGDADQVRLTFEVDSEGNLKPSPEVDGIPGVGEIIDIPDLYDTHNLVLEVRLDLAGMQVAPQAAISEPVRRGQALTFYWSLSPNQVGMYRGSLWVYLNLVPKGGGEIDRRALVAHRLDIEARSVLGLPANIARWGGAAGMLLGLVFSMPFIEDLLRKVWQWLRKKSGKNSPV
jgi:hypothetical protein